MLRKALPWTVKATLVVLAVAATPAWAKLNLYQQDFYTTLPAIDRWGCLDYECGEDALFNTVINVRRGTFVGTARACVKNKSCRKQSYRDVGYVYADQLLLCRSLYTVGKDGKAFFTGSGNVNEGGEM
jgi:hypothetical protein